MYNCVKHHKDIQDKLLTNGVSCELNVTKSAKNSAKFVVVTCLFRLEKSYKRFDAYLKPLRQSLYQKNYDYILIQNYPSYRRWL